MNQEHPIHQSDFKKKDMSLLHVVNSYGLPEVVLSDRSGPVFESLQRNVEVNHGDSVCKVRAVCLDWTKQSRGTASKFPFVNLVLR